MELRSGLEGPGTPSSGPGVLGPHPGAGLWTCPSQPASPPAQGPAAPGRLPEALPSLGPKPCVWKLAPGFWESLQKTLQPPAALAVPGLTRPPRPFPAGKCATPGHRTAGDTGLRPVLDTPAFAPSARASGSPLSPHPSPACSSPWGPPSRVRGHVPTGALTSTLLNTEWQERSPYMNLNLQVTPCLDPPGASPCSKSKATRPLGAHEALGPPSVPGTSPSLMGLWPQWLPFGSSVLPLPQGLCTCQPLWPVSTHSDSRTPLLGPPIDLPLSAVSPSPGVNRLSGVLSRCLPFLSGVPQRLLFPGQRPQPG